jgi:hypothetical protein
LPAAASSVVGVMIEEKKNKKRKRRPATQNVIRNEDPSLDLIDLGCGWITNAPKIMLF